jgi:hypothetical protein
MPIVLQPSVIAALVERFGHGQVILTRDEYYDAGRLLISIAENDRGEFVLTTFKQDSDKAIQQDVKRIFNRKPWWQE